MIDRCCRTCAETPTGDAADCVSNTAGDVDCIYPDFKCWKAKPSPEPSADSIMSAEPLARFLSKISQTEIQYDQCSLKIQRTYLEKATFILGFLQPLFARQREIGREEEAKRYAALVDMARESVHEGCDHCGPPCEGCAYYPLRKALRELDESKEAPHV